jgi:hypothetical protein
MIGLEALAPMAMGTATVAAPGVVATTPLWVALSGPVGWTLAGIGLLAVPFSWRLSKVRQKDKLETESTAQIDQVFSRLVSVRLPSLRNMGRAIAEEFQIRLDRQLNQTETAIRNAIETKSRSDSIKEPRSILDKSRRVNALLESQSAG